MVYVWSLARQVHPSCQNRPSGVGKKVAVQPCSVPVSSLVDLVVARKRLRLKAQVQQERAALAPETHAGQVTEAARLYAKNNFHDFCMNISVSKDKVVEIHKGQVRAFLQFMDGSRPVFPSSTEAWQC